MLNCTTNGDEWQLTLMMSIGGLVSKCEIVGRTFQCLCSNPADDLLRLRSLQRGVGFRWRGLLTGLTGDDWRSWVLQRHLWRTHIVASPGEKTEQSGNTGGISYCDVISHKTFSFSQMKEGEKRGKRWRDRGTGKDGGGTKGGQLRV